MGLSLIQWTKYTYNPWMGCRKVAPECDKCYIVRQTPMRVRKMKHGSMRHRCSESTLLQPLRWNAEAEREGTRIKVFCLSLGDWLDKEVPIEWLADLLVMIHKCKNLDWQLLTKRPQNFQVRLLHAGMLLMGYRDGQKENDPIALAEATENTIESILGWSKGETYPDNVWLGVSAGADQAKALEIPAKIHFLSCEPMLHALDTSRAGLFDWIIFGGESEPGGEPRPFDVVYLDRALKFCRQNSIPAFVKQMGGAPTYYRDMFDDGQLVTYGWRKDVTFPGGCTIKLDNNHGSDIEQWPERFQVREFPKIFRETHIF